LGGFCISFSGGGVVKKNALPHLRKKALVWAACLAALSVAGVRPLWAENGFKDYAKGDYPSAAEAFREQAKDSSKAVPGYNMGNALYKQGRFDESSKAYADAIQKDPKLEEGWYNLGNSLYRQDRWKDAIEAYQGALTLRGNDEDAKYNLELAQQQLKKEPKKDKSPPKDQPPQPTPTPNKGNSGQENKKGQNPDP
jgi:tetratricopeptide (TPR) repeat protein